MSIYKSKLWIEDIDVVLKVVPEIKELENKKVMITGAAGLVCSSVIDVIIRYNEMHTSKIQIYAAGRNIKKIQERFAEYCDREYLHFVSYNSMNPDNEYYYCDYIIHGAANSSPEKIVEEPVETMLSNILGINSALNYIRKSDGKRALFISSGEIYGQKKRENAIKENDIGYIDILFSRNSYSIGKQASETLCASYLHEYDVDSVIVRPGHIFGPTADKNDSHVSSMWTYNVVDKKNIVMKSKGTQVRSYIYCLDCASAIIKVLLRGEKGQAYNISNPNSIISIENMAETLCEIGNIKIQLEEPNDLEKIEFNPMDNSVLDGSKLINLGWQGCFDAKTGFEHTVNILREIQ